jgi:site-specific DNA-methyltransferase (adenine-specific)/adenine-specific DNA-methyltransferase
VAKKNEASYELSETEKRDLIQLIERGRPLPDHYRFVLFEDKREVELVWNGKTREVTNAVLPFQTLEHIDEPRKEARAGEELALDMGGRQVKGWTNKLIWGDNKLILSSLKNGALRRQIEDAGGLKLIYIDPPFDVGADFSMDVEIGGETFHKEPNILEQIAYRDTWGRGANSFIAMLYERLVLLRDLMATDATLYLHCDPRVNAFVRIVCDEIFGRDHFLNEIVWKRSDSHNDSGQGARFFGKIHDLIYVYSRTDSFTWNQGYSPLPKSTADKWYRHVEEGTGRRYNKADLTARKPGGNTRYEWKGAKPPTGRYWAYSYQKMEQMEAEGRLVYSSSGMPYMKRYLDESKGVPFQDLWDDIGMLRGIGGEDRLGYPTQKPEMLVERIIRTSSNAGDLVADFFVGSGTTAAVAEKLGRKWIATDLGKFGIHTTRKRLIQVQRELKAAGKPFRAFEVLNLGRYERQAYLNVSGRLSGKKRDQALARKEAEFRDLILRAYRAEPLPENGFFHGKHGGRLVVIGPINLPVGRLFVEEVITECRKRGASRVDILAFEFEMGLFPAILHEARSKGIDIAPKTIPPEVFDKRAVDKGQVRFADVAYIEIATRFDRNDKLTLAVELTDFSVYYSQGVADSITAELKAGKSEVLLDQGKLVKVSKSKDGVVTREVLTKTWTDWVDYWAIDFDYESRKEIIMRPRNFGVEGELPGIADASEFVEFEEHWTGSYIFENEWQSFRTRRDRSLELTSATHTYPEPGRYTIAVKVVDIFGNDTMSLTAITVG